MTKENKETQILDHQKDQILGRLKDQDQIHIKRERVTPEALLKDLW